MAIAFRAYSGAARGGTANLSVGPPAGTAAGDLLLLFATADNSNAATASGYTNAATSAIPWVGSHCTVLLWKIAGSSEPAASVATATSSSLEVTLISFSGVDTSTPFDVAAAFTTATTGATITVPALTTITNNAWWVVCAADNSGTTLTSASKPTGWTQQVLDPATQAAGTVCDTVAVATAGLQSATSLPKSAGTALSVGFALRVAGAAPTVPVADFTGTPLTGTEPLSVTFTDASTNTPTSWAWTFGDGGTSSSQNPTHSYTAAGTYTVVLVATNSAGSNTKTRTGYVVVSDQPRPIRINTTQGWADIGDATSFVSGTGAPTAAVGATGAIYLDTTSHRVYGPKAAGAWPSTPLGLLVPDYTGVANGWFLKIVAGVPAWSS